MARARNSAAAYLPNRADEADEIKAWYRQALADTLPPIGLLHEPVRYGPTWQHDGKSWVLPRWSLGWEGMAFAGQHLTIKGKPWQYTMEQARFLLWFYAVDDRGEFIYHSAVLQRLKGWGKDPFAAALAASVLVGPMEFDGWGDDGQPVGRQVTDSWVQIAAVNLDQSKNTMKMFPGLIPAPTRRLFGVQIGKQNVWARGDEAQIEAVTSSPLAIEGGRPKLIIRGETQNWNDSNGGHEMAGAMEGNAAKAEIGTPARMLDICNAYQPGRDSVGQQQREAWEETQGEDAKTADYGLMYDSLEAPPNAPLTREAAPDVVEAVRGDSVWLDAKGRILNSILNPANSVAESRRKWYNQVVAAEDAWTEPLEFDLLKDDDKVIERGEEVTLFLDCAKTGDATALVGCRMSDGHVFTLGMWQRPPGKRGDGWVVPRNAVDQAIREAVTNYRVVGFFGDPAHALDDETMDRFWDPLFSEWDLMVRRQVKVWASGKSSGRDASSVMFDMSARDNARRFAEAAAFTLEEIKSAAFTWDGDPRLRKHVLNARRYPIQGYVSIAKESRESRKKVDLAVAMIGARMVRRQVLTQGKKRGGAVW